MNSDTPKQLGLPVSLRSEARFDSFIVSSENMHVIAGLKQLASPASQPTVLGLWSEKYSGLSHLLQALCAECQQSGVRAQYLPLKELLSSPAEAVCEGLDDFALVCVDDIELCAGHPEWQQALFHLFNRLQEKHRSFVWAMHQSPAEFNMELADLRSRLLSGLVFRIAPLGDDDKMVLMQQRSQQLGLDMSDDLARYILTRHARNLNALLELIDVLDAQSLSQQRRLSIPFVREFLKNTESESEL